MKPEERSYQAYIEDMVESIEKILRYTGTVKDVDDFLNNDMVIEKYPEIPWRQMYGLRNFAVHDYHTIDPKILWEIAQEHLAENKILLQYILKEEKKNKS